MVSDSAERELGIMTYCALQFPMLSPSTLQGLTALKAMHAFRRKLHPTTGKANGRPSKRNEDPENVDSPFMQLPTSYQHALIRIATTTEMLKAASHRDSKVLREAILHKAEAIDTKEANRKRNHKLNMVQDAIAWASISTDFLKSPKALTDAITAAQTEPKKLQILATQLKLWRLDDTWKEKLKPIKHTAKDAGNAEALANRLIGLLPSVRTPGVAWPDPPTKPASLRPLTTTTTDLGPQTTAASQREGKFAQECSQIRGAGMPELQGLLAGLRQERKASRPARESAVRGDGGVKLGDAEKADFEALGYSDADLETLVRWRKIFKNISEFTDEDDVLWKVVGPVGGSRDDFLVECQRDGSDETEEWTAPGAHADWLANQEKDGDYDSEEEY